MGNFLTRHAIREQELPPVEDFVRFMFYRVRGVHEAALIGGSRTFGHDVFTLAEIEVIAIATIIESAFHRAS